MIKMLKHKFGFCNKHVKGYSCGGRDNYAECG